MQKKRANNGKLLLGIMAAAVIVFMAIGCTTTTGNKAIATGTMRDKVIVGTDQKVKTAVYIEVNDHNPLNAGSYVLEDGTLLFDYVILFAANIRNRDPEKGAAYVHLNENVQYILDNRNKYIVPLQEKGIKVLLALLGDHDGITFASLNDTERETFIADLKKNVEYYHLDGVNFDDEWASKEDWDNWGNGLAVGAEGKTYDTISPSSIWTYPVSTWGWPWSGKVYRNPAKGIEVGNGQFTEPTEAELTKMWKESGESYYKTILAARKALGADKIISLYEYNTGSYITPAGAANGTATLSSLEGALSFALQPQYNQYVENSANGLSRSKYSPFGIDLGGGAYSQDGTPLPPIVVNNDDHATDTIHDYATRFKTAATEGNAYNVLYFYNLRPQSELLKYDSSETKPSVTTEAYISRMTQIVFGQDVVLTAEGGDYRKDWSF
ncbi:MAG: hypothetical protein LBO67_09140 [Spirochaetaceae bacterium]|jgi:hypothetical protein|nr:hypothetical protein [Spirochaetaceae bacterium]